MTGAAREIFHACCRGVSGRRKITLCQHAAGSTEIMSRILLIYSTTDGHTREICERISEVVERQGHALTLSPIERADQVDIGGFDKVVIGASIRYGRHARQVYEFVESRRDLLQTRPNAFFSVNLVARKPEKNQPHANPYLQKFLRQIDWRPDELAVFAGKLAYPLYGFWDRQIIRLIMLITGGPTDPQAVVDFTDWDQVEAFARQISRFA